MFEKQFVDWLKSRANSGSNITIPIGDDAAEIENQHPRTLLTVDTLCDGVHFDSSKHSLQQIGRKAVAVSVSDILAMGGTAQHCLLSFFLPRTLTEEQCRELYDGAERLCAETGVTVVGGDTNRYDGPLIVSSTVTGTPGPLGAWKNSGAKVGDSILVTGPLGGSLLGHHLEFELKTDLISEISAQYQINAATDITDSLTLDLGLILNSSGQVGAVLEKDQIPVSKDAELLAGQTGKSPLDHALTDGEDFELILVVDQSVGDCLLNKHSENFILIGEITSRQGLYIRDEKVEYAIEPEGYVH